MRPHWSTLVDPLAKVEVVTVGEARGNTHALVDTLAETLAEVKAVEDKRVDARALVDTLADTLAVVGAVGDTRGERHALVDTLGNTLAQVKAVTQGVHKAMRRHWSNLLLTR